MLVSEGSGLARLYLGTSGQEGGAGIRGGRAGGGDGWRGRGVTISG